MSNNNTCSIFESGRIKVFTNVSLLAKHLKIHPETLNRHKRKLKSDGKIPVKYYDSVLVDFEPELHNNKK